MYSGIRTQPRTHGHGAAAAATGRRVYKPGEVRLSKRRKNRHLPNALDMRRFTTIGRQLKAGSADFLTS